MGRQVSGEGVLEELKSSDSAVLSREIEQQWICAREAVELFTSMDDALQLIREYVVSDECRPLVVCGDVGSGKTSLLARAALFVCMSVVFIVLWHTAYHQPVKHAAHEGSKVTSVVLSTPQLVPHTVMSKSPVA